MHVIPAHHPRFAKTASQVVDGRTIWGTSIRLETVNQIEQRSTRGVVIHVVHGRRGQIIDCEVADPHLVDVGQRSGRGSDDRQDTIMTILKPIGKILPRIIICRSIRPIIRRQYLITTHIAPGTTGICNDWPIDVTG